ncbi:Uncharacterized protein APZ42_020692 [Daphnia magna]|uniref:Uncharacterized protein n=1 Tax=Daphnia magna TaxID=35525 RepID=A0A164XBF2_9CRUS|nr:Uncharacterized protein APZ42_020692 [Daphnia magna]
MVPICQDTTATKRNNIEAMQCGGTGKEPKAVHFDTAEKTSQLLYYIVAVY